MIEDMKKYIWIGMGIVLLMAGCQKEKQKNYFPEPVQPVKVEINRLDQDLMRIAADTAHAITYIREMYQRYPDFMPHYAYWMVGPGYQDTAYLAQQAVLFLTDTTQHHSYRELNAYAMRAFADITALQDELNTAFSRLHHLQQDWEIPTVYLYLAGLSGANGGSGSAMGLYNFEAADYAVETDLYLGADCPMYDHHENIYNYLRPNMGKHRIAVDIVTDYLMQHISYQTKTNYLLDLMVYRGKLLFLCAQLLPNKPMHEIMGYSQEQWDWCIANEARIWVTMMDKKDLYNTKPTLISSYINEAPFTSEITQESPGRLGIWVGWRIVESYMRTHPELELRELMDGANNAQEILQNSNYRPTGK